MNIQQEGSGEGRSLGPAQLAALFRLLKFDREIASMRANLERRPKELDMKRREVAEQATSVQTAVDTVKAVQRRIDKKTVESDSLAAEVKKLDAQLFSLKSNDEFNKMKSQIANRKEKDDVLQTEILELMDAIQSLKADAAAEKEKLAALEKGLAKAEERIKAELAEAEADVVRVEADRGAALAELTDDLRVHYDRAFERRGSGVARLLDQVCKGCDTQVTMNIMGAVMGGKLVVCPHCQRLLVLDS